MEIAYILVSEDALFCVPREASVTCFYPGENYGTYLAFIYLTSNTFFSSSIFSLTPFQSCIIDLSTGFSHGGM